MRFRPIRSHGRNELRRKLEALDGRYSNGNKLFVVEGPQFFDYLVADIASTRESVLGNCYQWGKAGDGVVEMTSNALQSAARNGAVSGLTLDGFGAMRGFVEPLLSTTAIRRYHPVRPLSALRQWEPHGDVEGNSSGDVIVPTGRAADLVASEAVRSDLPGRRKLIAVNLSADPSDSDEVTILRRSLTLAAGRLNRLHAFVRSHAKGWAMRNVNGSPAVAWESGHNMTYKWRSNYERDGDRSLVHPRYDVALRIEGPGAFDKEANMRVIWDRATPDPRQVRRKAAVLDRDAPWETAPEPGPHHWGDRRWTGGVLTLQSLGVIDAAKTKRGMEALIEHIERSESRFIIVGPYLELPPEVVEALSAKKAANPKFRVDIVTNGTGNNQRLARQLGIIQYPDLLDRGFDVYEFDGPGMFHCKMQLGDVDGEMVVAIGSENPNDRSFSLDVEHKTYVFDPACARHLTNITYNLLDRCTKVEKSHLPHLMAEFRTGFAALTDLVGREFA